MKEIIQLGLIKKLYIRDRKWTRSMQSNWFIKEVTTIAILDYPNLVPLNFKIINQIYKTSELKLIHIHVHNSCCPYWKSENKFKKGKHAPFYFLTSAGDEQVPSYLVGFFSPLFYSLFYV